MAIKPQTQTIIKTGRKGFGRFFGIFRNFRTFLVFFIFGLILINSIIISVEARDIEPGVKYLGGKFIFATEKLNNDSQQIIDGGGVWVKDNNFIINIWNFIKVFFNIFSTLFIIYIWIKILSYGVKKVILQDESKTTASFVVAILFFFGLQMIFTIAFTEKSMMMPLQSFVNFGRAIPFIVKPAVGIAEYFIDGNTTINESINSSLGNMSFK